MSKTDMGQCSEKVWHPQNGMVRGWGESHRCSRNAVVVVDGKGYCKQHSPEAKQSREDKAKAIADAKRAEAQVLIDRLAAVGVKAGHCYTPGDIRVEDFWRVDKYIGYEHKEARWTFHTNDHELAVKIAALMVEAHAGGSDV